MKIAVATVAKMAKLSMNPETPPAAAADSAPSSWFSQVSRSTADWIH
jgi:hypothetical protein